MCIMYTLTLSLSTLTLSLSVLSDSYREAEEVQAWKNDCAGVYCSSWSTVYNMFGRNDQAIYVIGEQSADPLPHTHLFIMGH